MAASSTEEANISLEDIKETLDSIQATIEKVLFENGLVKTELKELKASLKAKDREVKNLQESLSKTRETNQLLKAELEAAKTKIKNKKRKLTTYGTVSIVLSSIQGKTVWKSLAFRRNVNLQKKLS